MSEIPSFKSEAISFFRQLFFIWVGFMIFTISVIAMVTIAIALGASRDVVNITAIIGGILGGLSLGFLSYGKLDKTD